MNGFFEPHEAALYDTLMERQKTQITFRASKVFECVSKRGKGCMVVTFGLPARAAYDFARTK